MSHRGHGHPKRGRTWEHIVPVLCLLVAPSVASSRPVLQFESGLANGSPLVRPNAVCLSSDAQTLCVTDEASQSIDLFDMHGFHQFRTDESSGISWPSDGTIDREGRFVFVEMSGLANRSIHRLSFLGEPDSYQAEQVDEAWRPVHLLISADGNYVTTDGRGVVAKHDAESGALLWSLPLYDDDFERADQIGRPAEAADGTIYVPLTGARQIAALSSDGKLLEQFGIPGSKVGELAFPVGVAVLGNGEILVLDRMRHCILVYSEDHTFLGESGHFGRGPGEFYHPVSIAASTDGEVYVAQGFEGRVQRFRLVDSELSRKDSGS
ncbi:MAG: NHL repeat-containing protein [Candidatus Eisenbacteria bacterium]|uniref:NHL repeat-containing protein n=1 Tax=Eiseniibacteriota bacterium TaxID=2212470 RepID=A0A956NFH6_UNCEI|nr:NHL repeat-containing protein [Candidatus Eisenbacteria bacterium]